MHQSEHIEQFIRQRPQLAAYVRSLISDPEDAADLLQDLGVAILVHGGGPTDPAQHLRWCRAMARNLALHRWRTARRRREVFDIAGSPLEVAVDADHPSGERARADRDWLGRSLESLDERSRRLLLLRYVAGRTSEEIARKLCQSPEAVRMKLMRILDVLRGRLRSSVWLDDSDEGGRTGS